MDIINNIKKNINEENRIKLIGLLTILISLWLILYFIRGIFVSLFNTLLGNLILITITILISSYNIRYGLISGLIIIILYRFSQLINIRENFDLNDNSIKDFLLIQHTINRQKIFDIDILKTQVSQEELDYFNSNGLWPWSDSTTQLYINSTNTNPYIRTYSKDGVNYARKIYNETAILEILSNQTNEGLFKVNGLSVPNPNGNPKEELPNGFGSFAYNSGLLNDRRNDIIKCNLDEESLERTTYNGKGGIFGEQLKETRPVDYNNLETVIPGFSFLEKPCNPCNSKCKFKLNIEKKRLYSE